MKYLISDCTMLKDVNTARLARFLIEISILRVVYLVAVLLPPLLVMLKVGIVINDALRQENSWGDSSGCFLSLHQQPAAKQKQWLPEVAAVGPWNTS